MADTAKFDRAIFGDLTQFDTTTAFNRTITEPSVSISDALGRKIDLFRTMVELEPPLFDDAIFGDLTQFDTLASPVPISDSVTGTASLFRSITEPSIVINDAVARVLAFARPIIEPTISILDAVARKIDLFRTMIESEPISDSVGRKTDLFRIITEPSISVSDSIIRVLALVRVIVEPTISILDSVARILIESANITFITRIKQSLSFTTRIKDIEDHSI